MVSVADAVSLSVFALSSLKKQSGVLMEMIILEGRDAGHTVSAIMFSSGCGIIVWGIFSFNLSNVSL
jgi:hypothetical protein